MKKYKKIVEWDIEKDPDISSSIIFLLNSVFSIIFVIKYNVNVYAAIFFLFVTLLINMLFSIKRKVHYEEI